jgi:hypothetical protein
VARKKTLDKQESHDLNVPPVVDLNPVATFNLNRLQRRRWRER